MIMNFRKNSKGITLIALVVAIIILLILAGVTLNLLAGGEGILGKIENVIYIHEKATAKEELQLFYEEANITYYGEKYVKKTGKTLKECIEELIAGDNNSVEFTTVNNNKISLDENALIIKRNGEEIDRINISDEDTSTIKWIYEEDVNGNINITGIDFYESGLVCEGHYSNATLSMNIDTLKIPSTIDGKKVTKVTWEQSSGMYLDEIGSKIWIEGVKNIVFGDDIEEISLSPRVNGRDAMYWDGIETVELPSSLKNITGVGTGLTIFGNPLFVFKNGQNDNFVAEDSDAWQNKNVQIGS